MIKKYLLLMLLAATAWAEPQLFVRNQPFPGPVRWFSDKALVPFDDLLDSLGCNWQLEEGKLRVQCSSNSSSSNQGGPDIREILSVNLEGRRVNLEQHLQQDRIFVDVSQVASAFQCSYRKSANGTVDLYAPLLSQGLGQGALRGDSEQRDFPIQLEQLQLQAQTGLMRGFARIKHRGSQPFKWVLVRLSILEKSGAAVARCSELVRDLQPGAEVSVQFPKLLCGVAQAVTKVEFEVRP